MGARHRIVRSFGLVIAGFALVASVLSGCGDDDGSAQDRYCEAGESLRSSFAALGDVDLLAEGTEGVRSAIDAVRSDADELRSAASDAAADEVAALQDAIDALSTALSDLGGDLTRDNVAAVSTAIDAVGAATQALFTTLDDC